MPEHDEDDPKKPQPVQLDKKRGSNLLEDLEQFPWDHLRGAEQRDRHRNV